MTTVFERGPGAFVGGEVFGSGDPPAHARDLVDTLIREGFRWVSAQITGSEASRRECALLAAACNARGFAFGTWAQGWERAEDEITEAVRVGARFHVANVETSFEDDAWRDVDLERAEAHVDTGVWPYGFAVIFTEGAWGRNRDLSARWRKAHAFAIPEAILSENPQATVGAMLELAAALGWPGDVTGPCVYLTKGIAASKYVGVEATGGRWSIFRYGDAADDWPTMRAWPKTPTVNPDPWPDEEPQPEPPTTLPSFQALEEILAILERAEHGGLSSDDTNLAIAAFSDAWKTRQETLARAAGRDPAASWNRKQRIVVNGRIARTSGPTWLAVDDTIDSTLGSVGA